MGWLPLGLGDEPSLVPRIGVGTVGRKIKLQANYFTVQIKNPDIELTHYDVAIAEPGKREVISEPGKKTYPLSKSRRSQIFEAMKEKYSEVFEDHALAYDAKKNAYCVSVIPRIEKEFQCQVTVPDRNGRHRSTFDVTLTVVNHACLRDLLKSIRYVRGKPQIFPQTIFQMLEVMFQHTPRVQYDCIGKNAFYSLDGKFGAPTSIGGGKECVLGFFSSLKPCSWKDGSLLLNIDIAHTVYYKEQDVLEYMKTLGYKEQDFNRTFDETKRRKLVKELKDFKIRVTHTGYPRTYKINNVTDMGADCQTFPFEDPNTKEISDCTVEKYFRKQYKKRLRYPKLNCLHVGPENRNIYIPIECCRISKGQKVNKKLNDRETGAMVRATAKRPSERLESICKIVQTENLSQDPMIKALEFTIADKPVSLDGRVLPPPKLMMNKEFVPYQGVWDARGKTFFRGAQLNHWVVMNYDPEYIIKDVLCNFLCLLRKIGQERGMVFGDYPVIQKCHTDNLERDFIKIKEKMPKTQMILVVLPSFGDIYARVKKTGDMQVKIITQCIKSTNVDAAATHIVGHLLLKINAKIGGTNNILSPLSELPVFPPNVMIMGADVNHPPAGDKITPSLAAVVASTDEYASKYFVEVRHQKHRTEMIQEMKEMTKNLLKDFYFANDQTPPERIIMYRDGVSESRFLEVLSFELKAMRDACTEIKKGYEPAITFIVVQKRHHTRLFCQETDGVGKSKNIPPGTTVDTDITHPTERDFYLCSHQGILGTSRPTHYHVLWDDSELNMDQLQKLTYAMCHLYSRCTRSVSIPAHAYYAHLVAFRAKVHIQDLCFSETSSEASGEAVGPSDAVMAQACKIERGHGIYSQLYYL